MKKKKRPIPEYKKTTVVEELFKPRKWQQSLDECILEIFPDTNPKKLKTWREMVDKMVDKEDSIEAETILFMAMICGAYFRISHFYVNKYCEDLHKWLTHRIDAPMNTELAEILIEVLRPGIQKIIEERGYQRGWPNGPFIRKRGRPPETKGAWVASFVAEKYFDKKDIKAAVSKELAINLASTLLGHPVELSEFYRNRKKAPKSIIPKLTEELNNMYNFVPSQEQIKGQEKEASGKKSIQNVIKSFGCDGLCRLVLRNIPETLLEPFWDIKIE